MNKGSFKPESTVEENIRCSYRADTPDCDRKSDVYDRVTDNGHRLKLAEKFVSALVISQVLDPTVMTMLSELAKSRPQSAVHWLMYFLSFIEVAKADREKDKKEGFISQLSTVKRKFYSTPHSTQVGSYEPNLFPSNWLVELMLSKNWMIEQGTSILEEHTYRLKGQTSNARRHYRARFLDRSHSVSAKTKTLFEPTLKKHRTTKVE